MVTITDTAADKIKEMIQSDPALEGKALRVFVEGGGCSGLRYGFAFDESRDGDVSADQDGFRMVVDSRSMALLEGASIDYVDQGCAGSGFAIDNPNVPRSCGCAHADGH